MNPKEIRWPRLLVIGLVATVISGAIWLFVVRSGQLVASPSWLAGMLLLVMAALVLWFARPVRQHLRGSASSATTEQALRAARAVVLAQASALTGAAVTGWYLGQLLVVLSDLELNREPRARVVARPPSAGGAAAGRRGFGGAIVVPGSTAT